LTLNVLQENLDGMFLNARLIRTKKK